MSPSEPNRCDCKWAKWHGAQAAEARREAEGRRIAVDWLQGELERAKQTEGKKRHRKTSIPALKPHTIDRYISSIPRAVARGEITATQGNSLLYAAQMLISLLRVSKPPTPTPRAMGFKKGEK